MKPFSKISRLSDQLNNSEPHEILSLAAAKARYILLCLLIHVLRRLHELHSKITVHRRSRSSGYSCVPETFVEPSLSVVLPL